ncbi:MAG: MFS transporter [Anaerolineae bacterium]|nr:MFS transporter [Anaerolineae bacterium]
MGTIKIKSHLNILKNRLRHLDVFATRGVHPQYHRGMKMFWWDSLLATMSGAFVDTYTSLYALALGATNTQIGALASASSFLSALSPLPGAALVRKLGRRKPLIVGVSIFFRTLILLAALTPLFFSGQTAVYIVIALFALRAGLGNLIHPAWVSMTGDVVPIQHRGTYFSARNTVMALASMVLVPLAGLLIDRIGPPRGYQWSLSLAFAVGLCSSYAYSRIPEGAPVAGNEEKRVSFWHVLRSNREFLNFTLIMLLWTFAVQVAGSYFSVYQIQGLGSTPRLVGTLTTVSSLSGLVGQRFWGRIVDRRGSRWVMTLCALLIPVVPWIWVLLTRPWHVIFVSLPGGFLWAGFNIASFNLLLELPDQKLRTQASASYATVVNTASIVAPLLGGIVIDHWGYRWDFALSGVLRFTAGVLFMLLLRPFGKEQGSVGVKEPGSGKAEVQGSMGAEEQGGARAEEEESVEAGEQGSMGVEVQENGKAEEPGSAGVEEQGGSVWRKWVKLRI